jgi:hypothetical protein
MSRIIQRACLVSAAAAVAMLAACAHSPDGKPAVCDGRHRRPANPYGSVLPADPAQPGPSPIVPVDPSSPIKPLSAIDPHAFAPCGGQR